MFKVQMFVNTAGGISVRLYILRILLTFIDGSRCTDICGPVTSHSSFSFSFLSPPSFSSFQSSLPPPSKQGLFFFNNFSQIFLLSFCCPTNKTFYCDKMQTPNPKAHLKRHNFYFVLFSIQTSLLLPSDCDLSSFHPPVNMFDTCSMFHIKHFF